VPFVFLVLVGDKETDEQGQRRQSPGFLPGRIAPSFGSGQTWAAFSHMFSNDMRAVEKVVKRRRGVRFAQVAEKAERINFKWCHSWAMQYDIMVL